MARPPSPDRPAVLVTGAARRIGRAIALDMASHGWAVALHYNTSKEEADSLAQDIIAAGGSAATLQADLASPADVAALVPAAMDVLGPVSCLINNASRFENDNLETVTPDLWQTHMDVNLQAPVFLTQSFARHLPEPINGAVINLIDQRVMRHTPLFFSYTLSKAGLWIATRTSAQALAPRIRVNAIAPGPTLPSSRQSDEHFKRLSEAVPLQRSATTKEICRAAQFILASPSMTGQMIILDGGQHLAWRTPDVLTVPE